MLLNWFGETKWRHQRHSSGWYLAKGNGQRYCSDGSTSGRQSIHWNLPELQEAHFVKRWCFPFLIPPQLGILWSVLHIGLWWGGSYGHNKPRYLELVRYLMRSTRIGSSFRQSFLRLRVCHQRWRWFWDSSPRINYKEIAQSLWYSVLLPYTSGVAYLGNFQKLKTWLTPTMTTSSRNYRHPSSSFPC